MTENESTLSAMSRHELRNIQLPVFFNTIRMQLQSVNMFRFIDALRDRGLQFTGQEKGLVGYDCAVHPGDISVALLKLKRVIDDRSSEAEVENLCSEIALPMEGKLKNSLIDLGSLWVNEDDYADACRQLGMKTYWWPKVESPLECADLEERRCTDQTTMSADDQQRTVHSIEQRLQIEEATAGQSTQRQPRRTRIRRAVEQARNDLKASLGSEPSNDMVIEQLRKNDPTGAVIDYSDGKLMWQDMNGGDHWITHKSVANTLSRIRAQEEQD